MKRALAFLGLFLCLSCGDGITNPNTSANVETKTSVCTINQTGSGNTAACGSVVVQPPAASPLPTVDPRITPVCVGEKEHNFEQNVIQAENSIEATQFAADYVKALAAALARAGFTVLYGTPLAADEIALKNNNTFSETYDVWTAENKPWVGYGETCRPARF